MDSSLNASPLIHKSNKKPRNKIHRIQKNNCFLVVLLKAKTGLTKYLLKNCSTDVCLSLLEIILNTVNGNIPISKQLKAKLKKYKKTLRNLINPKISVQSKRKTLTKIFKVIKSILKNFYATPISKQI